MKKTAAVSIKKKECGKRTEIQAIPEHGFYQIPNIVELAILQDRILTRREKEVLRLAIFRARARAKTWQECETGPFSSTYIENVTGILQPHAVQTLKSLVKHGHLEVLVPGDRVNPSEYRVRLLHAFFAKQKSMEKEKYDQNSRTSKKSTTATVVPVRLPRSYSSQKSTTATVYNSESSRTKKEKKEPTAASKEAFGAGNGPELGLNPSMTFAECCQALINGGSGVGDACLKAKAYLNAQNAHKRNKRVEDQTENWGQN